MRDLEASGFAEAIADARLLGPEQYDEFSRTMLSVCPDPLILAKELVYRGWLTPFQTKRILSGDAHTLYCGSYVLLDLLGQGGMSRVYRARNWKLGRIVAVKLINAEWACQRAPLARFQREIRALANINHPNIVHALDADIQPGTIYFAMEYFEGADLDRYVGRLGPLPVADACDFILQAAAALQHAHSRGLIHRDIKPSNMLLTEPSHTVKLLDLGLSRCEIPDDDSAFADLTRPGAMIGTPDFMSPEQVQDSRNTDIRSDLYGLGCTFYFLLAGKAPFRHLNRLVDKFYAQCENEPVPIERLRPDVPPPVAAIIRKLMAKRRRDRFQSPAELSAVLRGIVQGLRVSGAETIADEQFPTLIDDPVQQPAPEPSPTLILSGAEIPLICAAGSRAYLSVATSRAENLTAERPRRLVTAAWWSHGVHFLVASVLAASLLLVIWQAGLGPGGAGGRRTTPPSRPVSTSAGFAEEEETLPDDVEGIPLDEVARAN